MKLVIPLKNKKRISYILLTALISSILSFIVFPINSDVNFIFFFYCFLGGITCYGVFKNNWKKILMLLIPSSFFGIVIRILVEWGEVSITKNLNSINILMTIFITSIGIFITYLLVMFLKKLK